MAIFGWLVLLLITGSACLTWVAVLVGSIGLAGKLGGECAVATAVCAGLVYACYSTFPFVVTVAP